MPEALPVEHVEPEASEPPRPQDFVYDVCMPNGLNFAQKPTILSQTIHSAGPELGSPVLSIRGRVFMSLLGFMIPTSFIMKIPISQKTNDANKAVREQLDGILAELNMRFSKALVGNGGMQAGSTLNVKAIDKEEADTKVAELRRRIDEILAPFKKQMQLRIVEYADWHTSAGCIT